ncbi:MAG: protein kinase [Nitrososphaera sp.]|nr:protein kinase [Nitrososphaera sp.]
MIELIEQLNDALFNHPVLLGQVVQHLRASQNMDFGNDGIIIGDVIVAKEGSYIINRSDGAKISLTEPEHAEVVQALLEYRRRMMGQEVAAITEPVTLQPNSRLELNGKTYVIRELVTQRPIGNFVIRAARASDLSVGRNVGIRQAEALNDSKETHFGLQRMANQARKVGQAASRCRQHLPELYDVIEMSPDVLWVIIEWVDGTPLAKLLPQEGSWPDTARLRKLLSWGADICEALTELHRQHLLHLHVNERTILISRGNRGAVLIDPAFTHLSGSLNLEQSDFNSKTDIHDLAATLYRVSTHHLCEKRLASEFNPAISEHLAETLQAAISGSFNAADKFKRALLAARHTL